MKRRAVAFVSVVPSPYQRDLFAALASRPEIDLRVFYLEAEAPDSPWPSKPLANYESILPGRWLAVGAARVHFNAMPRLCHYDLVVMNTLMSATAQWLMRVPLRKKRWIFWGERLQGSGALHKLLAAPCHQAAAIAAIGSIAQRDYAARFPEPRSFLLPYYCDLTPFLSLPRGARSGEDVIFLFCGQMIARKGIDILLAALERVPRARLHLVGREAELPQLLQRLPAAARARVEYLGFQAPDALPQFFARADVFVLPSRHDGWGVVVNQALGAGLPLLCSDGVGAAHDLLKEKVNGLMVPAGDAMALAAAMQSFIDHPEQIDRFGAASREMAAQWTAQCGAAKWLEIFEAVNGA